MARRCAITYRELEESLVRQTGTGETVYRCPFCEERVGIRDRRGHLYVNVLKMVGHCFRCDVTVKVIDGPMNPIAMDELDAWLNPKGDSDPADERGGRLSVGVPISMFLQECHERGFRKLDIASPHLLHDYLKERHIGILTAINAKLQYNQELKKVLFPYLNPYDLVSIAGFAERGLEDGTWNYSRAGQRNLYIPTANIARSVYWVLVEGPPDALSLVSRGFPAVAIGGTSMSEAQALQIGLFLPKYIDIFFDTDAASYMSRLAEQIQTVYRGKSKAPMQINLIYAPSTKDPSMLNNDELYDHLSSEHQIILPNGATNMVNEGGPVHATD